MIKPLVKEPYLTHSRNLRKQETPWEAKLWARLRAGRFYGLKFKRQAVLGPYIYDILCFSKKVIIELDGGQHSEKTISDKDREKQKYARRQGYKVVRFWNNEVDSNLEGILQRIKEVCGV